MVNTTTAGSQQTEVVSRYSSEEISGNESAEVMSMTETERQADFNRHKEEMKKKRRKKKRTSSSLQSSTFQGKLNESCCFFVCVIFVEWMNEWVVGLVFVLFVVVVA